MATGFLSPLHVALLLVVVLMLFGAKRLPEFGRSLGSGMRRVQAGARRPEKRRPSSVGLHGLGGACGGGAAGTERIYARADRDTGHLTFVISNW